MRSMVLLFNGKCADMAKPEFLLLLSGSLLFVNAPASFAQMDIDCANAAVQMEMTYCAEQDFKGADAQLNRQYRQTRQAMKDRDTQVTEDIRGAEDALIIAQRAWIAYRDAHCASYGYQARGGSMEPMLIYLCRAELTRERTRELESLFEGLSQ